MEWCNIHGRVSIRINGITRIYLCGSGGGDKAPDKQYNIDHNRPNVGTGGISIAMYQAGG